MESYRNRVGEVRPYFAINDQSGGGDVSIPIEDSEQSASGFGLNEESVAVVHEHFPARGGGEFVAEHLARTFDAPLYTGFVASDVDTADDVEVIELFEGRLKRAMIADHPLVRDGYYMFAWQQVPELAEYDVIVQSGNNPGWYVPRDDQTIVRYVHTPPRSPFDAFDEIDTLKGRLYAMVARTAYLPNVAYADRWIANSELVARRLELYWDINRSNIEVVYPPVDTSSFGSEHRKIAERPYYLTLSRLHKKKRISDIIRACNYHGARLIVAGDGPDRDRLEEMAGNTIEFAGYVSEREKRELMASADALIFNASNEDFGLVPIEAMASGTPVLGVRDGFTQHQIADGVNGMVYERGTANLQRCLRRFEANGVEFTADELEEHAEQYDVTRFEREMQQIAGDATRHAKIEVPLGVAR